MNERITVRFHRSRLIGSPEVLEVSMNQAEITALEFANEFNIFKRTCKISSKRMQVDEGTVKLVVDLE